MSPNSQHAARLEEMAAYMAENGLWAQDAPLLRESAAMWRERESADGWDVEYRKPYKHFWLTISNSSSYWVWHVSSSPNRPLMASGYSPTLDAAKAAAIAWVDAQKRK